MPTQQAARRIASAFTLAVAATAQLPLRHSQDGGTPHALFGSSVSSAGDVDGDGRSDLLVGAPFYSSSGAAQPGTVAVVSGATGGTLYSLSGAGADWFGSSVAPVGDVDLDGRGDFVVGAPRDGTLAPDGGRAALFSGATGAVLFTWFGAWPNGNFGARVAGLGDLDADGVPDVAVNSPNEGSTGFGAGAMRFYSGATGALLSAHFGGVAQARLATAAGLGDINGDGAADFALGYSGTAAAQGLGQVVARSGATGAVLYAVTGTTYYGGFGQSLSSGGDANGDGVGDFVVGEPYAGSPPAVAGAAALRSGVDGALLRFVAGPYDGALTGGSVAMAGDVDGDGAADFVVGSWGATDYGPYTGAATIYSGATGATLAHFVGAAASDAFGQSVAGAGDVDGDGFADVVVGAPQHDGAGTNAGRATTYSVAGARSYGAGSGIGAPPPSLTWLRASAADPALGAIMVGGAPSLALGFLGASPAPWFETAPLFTLLIDPTQPSLLLVPLQCDATGSASFSATLRIPALAGFSLFLQSLVEGYGGGALAASNGLELRFTS